MDLSIYEEQSLKMLQVHFLKKLARWANFGKNEEPVSFDLPETVLLLQSCGYSIRRVDTFNPEDVTPLRDNEHGNRIVISCMHSGQRCFLEKVQPKENCSCTADTEPNKEGFWEVMATTGANSTLGKNASLIETGSNYIPRATKEQKFLIKNVMSFLVNTLREKENDDASNSSRSSSLSSLTGRGVTSSPERNYKRLSGFLRDIGANPPIIISPSVTKTVSTQGKGSDSPARYRSLDTLTTTVDNELTVPEKLTPKTLKVAQESHLQKLGDVVGVTKSSPNLAIEETNSSGSTIGESQNEKAIKLLKKAINILERNKSQNIISPSNFMNPLNLLRGKTEQKKKSPAGSAKFTSTPNVPKDTSKTIVKQISKQALKIKPLQIKKTPQVNKNENTVVSKKSNLYAHVKSTIPKASSSSKLGEAKNKS